MSIATELTRIQQAKADIKTAIEAKGVTVPSSATIDTYDDYVSQISGGGGSSSADTALKGMIDRSITSIDIPSDVTSIGLLAFRNCTSLSSVTIPNSVTNIDNYAFYGCTSLSSVTIPNSVTSIGSDVFNNCSSLSSVTIPNSVTSIGSSMFYGCSRLTSCTLPSGITSINFHTFYNCTSLSSVTIPSGVTSIGNYAFYGCTSLTSIIIPSGVTSIAQRAFSDCTSLTSLTCEATTPPSLSNVNAFNNTNNCPIYVPSGSVEAYKAANNWSTYASRIQAITSLEYIPFDTRMEQYQDKYIKRIVIGDSSTYSGGTFDMGETGGSRLHFNTDGSVTAYGDFVVDGVTNLTLPIDITPVNPVQLTSNNWGKTTVISWWPYEAEVYNGFSDLHIEWQN